MKIFKNLEFEYNGMTGSPTSYKYEMLKDSLKWEELEEQTYIPLITAMFRRYVNTLPKK